MRILMLTQFYPPFIGGEERIVATLSTELAARGHQVAVATMGTDELPEFEVDRGVRVYRVRSTVQRLTWLFTDPGHPHAPPMPDPELTWSLRRIVAREQPDIVHAHNWMVYSFWPLKRWSGAKLVLSLHDYGLACATKKLLYRDQTLCSGPGPRKCLECSAIHYGRTKGIFTAVANGAMRLLAGRFVDLFLPVSHAAALGNRLVEYGLPFEVLPNFLPVRDEPLRPGHESYLEQLPAGDFLLFVGAFGSYKGLDVLFEAYAGLVDVPPLVVIGYETKEHPVATADFPPNVVIAMNWPHDCVMEAWRRCTVAVVPSVTAETFGIVALEAMSTGRPVIASGVGGLTDLVVDGETGLLVEPHDTIALRRAIRQLLTSPDLRERFGAAGEAQSRMFGAEAVLARLEAMYRALVAGFPSAGAEAAVGAPGS